MEFFLEMSGPLRIGEHSNNFCANFSLHIMFLIHSLFPLFQKHWDIIKNSSNEQLSNIYSCFAAITNSCMHNAHVANIMHEYMKLNSSILKINY